jgi:predicted branched-subunit amino acid permease
MNRQFMAGMKMALPAALSLIPLGISIGLVATQAGMNALQAGLMTFLVMCGSGEILALGMVIDGAPLYLILTSVFFMSLKNMIFCSSAMQRIGTVPLWRRLLCCFNLCDVGVGIFCTSPEEDDMCLLGVNTMVMLGTALSTSLGALMTDALPQSVANSFGIALYAVFLSMIIPSASRNARLMLLVLFSAGLNWALRFVLPTAWALVAAMMIGAFIGVWFVDLDSNDSGKKK